jgi:hypothetical protein
MARFVSVGPGKRGLRRSMPDWRLRQGFADPHFLGIIAKLFAALEACHVGLDMTKVTLSDRSYRSGQMFVSAPKKQLYKVVDQLCLLVRGISDFIRRGNYGTFFKTYSNYHSGPVCN